MLVLPSELVEVIWSTPAICPSLRSSGAATVAAITEGSAPGRDAKTRITGKSTLGTEATGRFWYATPPTRNNPIASSVVPTGLLMNGPEIDTIALHPLGGAGDRRAGRPGIRHRLLDAAVEAIQPEIDHRRGVEREQLAQQQAANDGDAER